MSNLSGILHCDGASNRSFAFCLHLMKTCTFAQNQVFYRKIVLKMRKNNYNKRFV